MTSALAAVAWNDTYREVYAATLQRHAGKSAEQLRSLRGQMGARFGQDPVEAHACAVLTALADLLSQASS